MPKSNNDKSWPHQKFHNANKSINQSSSDWESRSYRYNNSGEIKKINYKWGLGATITPGSILYEASYTDTTKNYDYYSVKK